MWTLIQTVANEDGTKLQFWLCAGRSYLVGRKEGECDLFIENDRSISRSHATVVVSAHPSLKDVTQRPTVSITDTSTYGTVISGKQAEKSTAHSLCSEQEVQFGVFRSVFALQWVDVTLCLSKTSSETKKKLRSDVLSVGAHITMSLDNATHVVTDTIMPMFICFGALAKGIPIVSPGWVASLAERGSPKTPPPDPAHYIPPAAEIWADIPPPAPKCEYSPELFRVNNLRRSLFAKRFFVFLEETCYAANKDLLHLCGATAFNESTADLVDSKAAREAFFIRHRGHYLIVSALPNARTQAGALNDEEIALKYKVGIAERLGFTPVEQSSIIAAVLWAATDAFKAVRFPTKMVQEEVQSVHSVGLTQNRSSLTRIGTFGSELQGSPSRDEPPNSVREDDLIGTIENSGGEEMIQVKCEPGVPAAATLLPSLFRTPQRKIDKAKCAEEEKSMNPSSVDMFPTTSKAQSSVASCPQGGTVPQGEVEVKVEVQSTPKRKRKQVVEGDSDDDDPVDAFFGNKRRKVEQPVVKEEVEMEIDVPVPIVVPVVEEQPQVVQQPCDSETIMTETVLLVPKAGVNALLDPAFPCFQEAPRKGRNKSQKTFVKQHLGGGIRQGLDVVVKMREYQTAAPAVRIEAESSCPTFEDLITTAPRGVRGRKASGGSYAEGITGFASKILNNKPLGKQKAPTGLVAVRPPTRSTALKQSSVDLRAMFSDEED